MLNYQSIKKYSNISIFNIQIRNIQFSPVLSMDNNDLNTTTENVENLGKTSIELSDDDVKKLLDGLSECRANSEAMTVSEYLSETISDYDEAFPNLSKKDEMKEEYLKTVKISELEGEVRKLQELYPTTSENAVDRIVQNVNKEYLNIIKPDNQDRSSKIIVEYTPDGKLIFDVTKIQEVWDKTQDFVIKNIGNVDAHASVCLYGLTTLMVYRGVLYTFKKFNATDLSSFKTDKSRLAALRIMQRNNYKFATFGSLIVLGGLQSMFAVYRHYNPNQLNISVTNTTSNATTSNTLITNNKPSSSFMLLFSYFKKLNKWIKILIVLILFVLVRNIVESYLGPVNEYYELFINNLIYVKIILVLIIGLTVLYNIYIISVINKFTVSKNKPILPKYLPSFIKNEILCLYDISQTSELEKMIVINHIKKTNLAMLFLMLLGIIFILIPYL